MSKFSDYLASQITPQMTLLEKFNLMIKFLQENNYISIFYSQENYNIQTESYQKEKVNLNGFTLHIGDCIIFSNGYYAFVETVGINNFTIGNVLYFQGEQGVSVVGATISSGHLILTLSDGENIDAGNLKGVSNFSINSSQHLVVNYQDGTSQDLGAIFSGNVNINGTLNASKITGDEIVETMTGYGFTKLERTNLTKQVIYAGACKNGNKLSFVIACNFTRTGEVADGSADFSFTIPSAIGQKLYNTTVGTIPTVLATGEANYTNGISITSDHFNYYLSKASDTKINIFLYGANRLTSNTTMYCRMEWTFLLSDNLAS